MNSPPSRFSKWRKLLYRLRNWKICRLQNWRRALYKQMTKTRATHSRSRRAWIYKTTSKLTCCFLNTITMISMFKNTKLRRPKATLAVRSTITSQELESSRMASRFPRPRDLVSWNISLQEESLATWLRLQWWIKYKMRTWVSKKS